ncbi:transposase [Tessaracoccus defluvii]|uniref:Transposase n=1 Tax=Tessaracoccus defluvii TaxID=1285901 RepID=A0A7H0H5M7_9ACTN|nr:transposase [Tessaracoccus defluvii]
MQDLHGHRGRAQDPLYRARRTHSAHRSRPAHPRRQARVDALFAVDDHVQLEATYGVYQQLVAAYREPDRATGRGQMEAFIASVSSGVPSVLA